MAERIEEARVRQKADTLDNWNNNELPLLDGEQAFIRSDVDDMNIGFKLGSKNKKFSELPYPDYSVRGKVSPTSTWVGRQSGVYIPTLNGDYNGITVNLGEGYQVLFWDGVTIEKVVYPNDFTGLVFGGVIDDSYDLSNPTEAIWYIASPGTYNTDPETILTEQSILTWNGTEWSHAPFNLEIRGEFLVADNVEELRNITPQVAELLTNGTYKGVTLLGYYVKGDTPAPIEYYLSNTTNIDDGGSVFEIGGIKLKHDFGDFIHVSYFGAKGGDEFDNSLIYNNIISSSVEHGHIEWYCNQTYVGNFISNKPLILNGNNCTLKNFNNNFIIHFNSPVIEDKTRVIGALKYGDSFIKVTSVSEISVGDIITVYDSKGRPQDGALVNYESLLVKMIDTVNSIIEVHDMIRSEQNQGDIKIDLTKNPMSGIKISNFNTVSTNNHDGGNSMHVSCFGCLRTDINNITTYNNVGPAVQFRRCIGFAANNVTHNRPRLIDGGQGYGTTANFSRNGYISNINGYYMRHTIDFSACYSIEVDTVKDYSSYLPIALAHNTFGGNMIVRNIVVDGISDGSITRGVDAALHIQSQGLPNANVHVFRDLEIDNITLISNITGTATTLSVILIQCSLNNVLIRNIKLINNRINYDNTSSSHSVVFLGSCSINGNVKIENVYSNKINSALTHSLGTMVSLNNALITVSNIKIDNCNTGFNLLGTGRFEMINCNFVGAIPSNGYVINNYAGTYMQGAYIDESNIFSSSVRLFNSENTSLLYGKPFNNSIANFSSINIFSNTTLSRVAFDHRTILKLIHTPTGDLNITSSKFLPNPDFYGERKTIIVNNPSDYGILGNIIIPPTNTNIINENGEFGATFKSGQYINLVGSMIGSSKVWIIEKVSRQSLPVANAANNSLPPADTTSTASDLASVVVDLNDLISKYNTLRQFVAENRTTINNKLAADRNSGQQLI
ncbi:MAG: hypothetical protein [Caudoviricetes sp.]|nr:MAG: hypothetical protein [Caudoviricetes sp.]